MRGYVKNLMWGLVVTVSAAALVAGCSDSDSNTEPTVEPDGQSVVQAIEASDRYIVKFQPGAAAAGRAAVAARGSIVLDITGGDAVAVRLPDAAVTALQNNPNIALIEKDAIRKPLADPSSTYEHAPYGIGLIQADQVAPGGDSRTVCIIDSGLDTDHEDLQQTGITGYTPVSGPNWSDDTCGHGTHVAGTIAALGGNGKGVVGVNPDGNLNLHIVRVFGDGCSWAYASDLADAARRCAEGGANVISMSLGCASGGSRCYSSVEDSTFQDLYDGKFRLDDDGNFETTSTAQSPGVLNVAAASNDGKPWYSYPASYDSVVSVAAVDQNQNHASFSNSNDAVEVAAPGVGVWSTLPTTCYYCDSDAGYAAWNGTSMATPHVAGVAALLWTHDASLTNQAIRDALNNTASDLGASGRDKEFGYGLIQAEKALTALGYGAPECATAADCIDGPACTTASCDAGSCTYTLVDEDGDGYSTCDGDCDDLDGSVNPGAAEVCGDGVDNDCSGTADDADEDGYVCGDDCDDSNDAINPGVIEVCDGVDNNCDGTTDEGCPVCVDDDNDGYDDVNSCSTGQDCDDADASTNPGADEVCDDGVDNNCDGNVDEGCSCSPAGARCDVDSDCCSQKCKGKPGSKTCK